MPDSSEVKVALCKLLLSEVLTEKTICKEEKV